jgi:hypothetical protein
MTEIIDQNHPANLPAEMPQQAPATTNPFQRMQQTSGGMNHAVVEIESQRAIAEAQGKQLLARKFPRSMTQAMADFMEACKIPEFANVAFYAVPNRGSGPSIRFAEEAARCYGNFEFGHKELSRDKDRSVVVVYAWDTEKGNHSERQITVMHVVDTKNGPKVLRDQTDIDNRIANVASKQMRGRILALLPKGMVMAGIEACKKTIAGDSEKPISQRVNAMVAAFSKYGVGVIHLETKLGHTLDVTTVDELADLIGIFNALKEGGKASEYFDLPDASAAASTSTAAALTNTAKQAAANAPAPAAEASPQRAKATTQKSKPVEGDGKPAKAAATESSDQAAIATTQEAAAPATQQPASQPQPNAATTPKEDDVF